MSSVVYLTQEQMNHSARRVSELLKNYRSKAEFAVRIGTYPNSLQRWISGKHPVSPQCVFPIVYESNNTIHPHELRPDIFPPNVKYVFMGSVNAVPEFHPNWGDTK